MMNTLEFIRHGIHRLVQMLEALGVTERDVNAVLLTVAFQRWVDEVGEEQLRHILLCEINQIDEGAYRDDYVSPEARMADEDEARERRQRLTVIEGGRGVES